MSSRVRKTMDYPNEADLEAEVKRLNESFKTFRAEIDMKMSIVEQVLTTRNETYTMQKKLLEREQTLHDTILSHWKNIPQLAATGLSLRFTNESDDADTDVSKIEKIGTGKRSAASARRSRRKKLKTKVTDDSDSESCYEQQEEKDPLSNETQPADDSIPDNDESRQNFEKKVFVNCYTEDAAASGTFVRSEVWKYYLREEGGGSALCKLCDEVGVQTIFKVRLRSLQKHLKEKHDVTLEQGIALKSDSDPITADNSVPSKKFCSPIWRHYGKYKNADSLKAYCKHCKLDGITTEYKILDGSTSTLHYHLKNTHTLKSTDSGPRDDLDETAE